MRARPSANRELLKLAVAALGPLGESMVFVGGATIDLLLTEPGAPEARGTEDVDALVQVASRIEMYAVESELRRRRFSEDVTGGPICRWHRDGLVLDVMPTNAEIYGFANRWLPEAFDRAVHYRAFDLELRHARATDILAMKLEAFASEHRAHAGDVYASRDVTDIATIIDGRPEIEEEIRTAPEPIRAFVIEGLRGISRKADLGEIVESHIAPNALTPARIRIDVARWRRLLNADSDA